MFLDCSKIYLVVHRVVRTSLFEQAKGHALGTVTFSFFVSFLRKVVLESYEKIKRKLMICNYVLKVAVLGFQGTYFDSS